MKKAAATSGLGSKQSAFSIPFIILRLTSQHIWHLFKNTLEPESPGHHFFGNQSFYANQKGGTSQWEVVWWVGESVLSKDILPFSVFSLLSPNLIFVISTSCKWIFMVENNSTYEKEHGSWWPSWSRGNRAHSPRGFFFLEHWGFLLPRKFMGKFQGSVNFFGSNLQNCIFELIFKVRVHCFCQVIKWVCNLIKNLFGLSQLKASLFAQWPKLKAHHNQCLVCLLTELPI